MSPERSNTLWLAATALAALFLCWMFSEEARDAKTNEKKTRAEIVELREQMVTEHEWALKVSRELEVCAADEYALGLIDELKECREHVRESREHVRHLLAVCEPRQ